MGMNAFFVFTRNKPTVCRANCTICDHSNGQSRNPPPCASSWSETVVSSSSVVSVLKGPLRHRFVPRFGTFPHFHTGDGLLHVISVMGVPIVKQLLHFHGSLPDDFHALQSSPYHVETDEFVLEEVSADLQQRKDRDQAKGHLPLFASIGESFVTVTGPLHVKVFYLCPVPLFM